MSPVLPFKIFRYHYQNRNTLVTVARVPQEQTLRWEPQCIWEIVKVEYRNYSQWSVENDMLKKPSHLWAIRA